jgi:hydroxymethylpyrimidine pyrophosphatase-like HAD family hydrolase
MVVLNGALGVLPDGGRFHRATYPVDEATLVLDAFESVGLEPVVYVDHPSFEVVLGPSPSTNPAHAAALAPTARRGEPRDAVRSGSALGFSLIGVEHPVAVAAEAAIGDLGITHLDRSLDHPGMVSLTVAPRHRSKWDGVVAYCDLEGLDATRVLALGDGPNDVELLDGAAVRLVPQGSHPGALERGDHVVGSARAGGWAEVLDHLG